MARGHRARRASRSPTLGAVVTRSREQLEDDRGGESGTVDPATEAREMLVAWARVARFARGDLDRATLESVRAVGPTQIVLRLLYEERTILITTLSAGPPGEHVDPLPDRWSESLDVPLDTPLHQRVTGPPSDPLAQTCSWCHGRALAECQSCEGDGETVDGEGAPVRCERCRGRGELPCVTCAETGRVLVRATLSGQLAQTEAVCLVDDERAHELPNEVYLDLQDTEHGGRVVLRHRGATLDGIGGGGYRDAALSGDVLERARALAARADVPRDARVRRFELEVRKVPAYALRVGRAEVIVYGEPPRVHPERALTSLAYRALSAPVRLPLAAIRALVRQVRG